MNDESEKSKLPGILSLVGKKTAEEKKTRWIAHLGSDELAQTFKASKVESTEEDKLESMQLGRISSLTIEEELSKPFILKGEASFFYKISDNMIGKKFYVGLKMGSPHQDTKHWHGVISEWSYNGIKSFNQYDERKLYIYSFVLRPEIEFKLQTMRNRIFFPSSDGGQNEKGFVPFNKAKLMELIKDNLIKANGVKPSSKANKERDENGKMIKFYNFRKTQLEEQLDLLAKDYDYNDLNTSDKKISAELPGTATHSKTTYEYYGRQMIDIYMDLVDVDYKLGFYKQNHGKYLNFEDKTQFETDEKEEYEEYIVQYNETDWDFMNRLFKEFGIYYCFEHSDQHSGMIIYNNPQNAKPSNDVDESGYNADDEEEDDDFDTPSTNEIVEKPTPIKSAAPKKSYKTYIDYAEAIKGYKPNGYVGDTKHIGKRLNEKRKHEDSDNLKRLRTLDGSASGVYKMSPFDPFTESKPLHYTRVDRSNIDDKYIMEWKAVHRHVISGVNTYGYNPDYDPEKRNILAETENEKETKTANDQYSETFTTDQKTKDYQELYGQHAKSVETEYHTKTARQEASPGYKFVLTHHPDTSMNGQYYVKKSSHRLYLKDMDGDIEDGNFDNVKLHYENDLVLSKIDQPFKIKPEPRRQILGIQTGVVVGPEDKEVYTNKMGHVKVYFHWDHDRKKLTKGEMLDQAVWIRVAQWGGAGNNWGGFFVPRVNQEVVIAFENGNPSYPIITGCLYNRTTLPPYDLTKDEPSITTGLKTKSLKEVEGDEFGFNELSFDDKANEEKIFLHAEKDYDEVIKDSKKSKIETGSVELTIDRGDRKITLSGEDEPTNGEGNDTLIIKNGNKEIKLESEEAKHFLTQILKGDKINKIDEGNYNLEIKKGNEETKLQDGNFSLTMSKGDMEINLESGNQKETVSGNKNLTVKNGNYTIKISGGNMEISANKITQKASGNLTIEAGGNLELKAGGSLKLKGTTVAVESSTTADIKGSAMVNIKGGMVNLN